VDAQLDSRLTVRVGRQARLELVFANRRGRTVLADAYAEPPLRVGRLFDAGSFAQLILVCGGPGVFAGDALKQSVRVERGARVVLVSQAALQIHPSAADAPATMDAVYDVEAGGELCCFWDPVIPFSRARLRQRIRLRLAEGSRLFWSDALMAGRVGRAEAWRFDALDHELRVEVGTSLKYLERYHLTPDQDIAAHAGREIASGLAEASRQTRTETAAAARSASRRISGVWTAGLAHYLGTTIVHDEDATALRAEEAQHMLNAIGEVRAGADCPAANLIVARLLAWRGPAFTRARELLRDTFSRLPLRR
jgi:urease accessory protein UreH